MGRFVLFGVALLCWGCQTPEILKVKTGPHTEYPCGVGGNVCNGSTVDDPICCGPGFACFPIGAAKQDACEFVGDDMAGTVRDAGPSIVPVTHPWVSR